MVEVASSGGFSIAPIVRGPLCVRLVSSFPSSRWEDWRLVHLCCFGGAVTRLLEHSRVQTYESPWMACTELGSGARAPLKINFANF
jgi:hypothetical protein